MTYELRSDGILIATSRSGEQERWQRLDYTPENKLAGVIVRDRGRPRYLQYYGIWWERIEEPTL